MTLPIVGSLDAWSDFIGPLVPRILTLVIETWESMSPPRRDAHEDPISKMLCYALRQSRTLVDLPFSIHYQYCELDPAPGQDQGRIDIVFVLAVPLENIYFALECKRLHVTSAAGFRPYYSEYVTEGMIRFVSGRYAKAVRDGSMLAFVLDGDTARAKDGVGENMRSNSSELGMDPPGDFQASRARPGDARVYETHHRRSGQMAPIVIHHLFMAGDPNSPLHADESVVKEKRAGRGSSGRKPRK
jgi:hypothetical protein